MTHKIKQGEIWLANLGQEKNRPVLVMQSQTLLDVGHPSTIVIPLTTHLADDAEPLRLRIKAQDKMEQDSDLLIDQIRTIENTRFVEGPLMHCNEAFMKTVYEAVYEVIGALD